MLLGNYEKCSRRKEQSNRSNEPIVVDRLSIRFHFISYVRSHLFMQSAKLAVLAKLKGSDSRMLIQNPRPVVISSRVPLFG